MKTNKSIPAAAVASAPLRRRAVHFAVLLATALSCALSADAASGANRQTSDGTPGDQTMPQLRSATPSGSAGSLPSAQLEGSLDKVEVASVGGWAWDASQPNVATKVDIYDGTTLLSTVIAEEYREDLKSAGKGDGKHAFNYALPRTLRDGKSHTISVRYAGTASELPGSPKTLLFPGS